VKRWLSIFTADGKHSFQCSFQLVFVHSRISGGRDIREKKKARSRPDTLSEALVAMAQARALVAIAGVYGER
jgi:hypothetical protein